MSVKMAPLSLLLLGAILIVNVSGFSILISTTRRVATNQARLVGLFLMNRPSKSVDDVESTDPKIG